MTSSSYSNSTKIAEEVEKNAKKELPEIFQLYSDDLKKIDDAYQNIASLDGYFTQAEKDLYVDNFFSEGYINGGLKLVPTAKSTELFMMNKTDWDVFAEDYNKSASEETKVSLEDLSTVEGIAATAEKYYLWSGGDDGGKAFFGRDAYANFFLTSARSLGHTIFEKDGEKIELNTDRETFKKIYDNFYVPYVKGYFYAKDRFRSDDVKTGDLLAYVGSTSSAGYFPSSVQESDTVSHAIETYVPPVPVFAGGQKVAIQQGAGFAVKKSDKATEAAAGRPAGAKCGESSSTTENARSASSTTSPLLTVKRKPSSSSATSTPSAASTIAGPFRKSSPNCSKTADSASARL